MSDRTINDTVTICGATDIRPQIIIANEMWLKNRSVPKDYLESVLGNASITIAVHSGACETYMNGAKPKRK